MTEPLTFTIPGAARRIGCGEKKVRAEVKAGRLPTVLVGDQTRILYSDIHKYLADRRRTACPSTDAKARRSGGTISPSTVVGFEEARRLRPLGRASSRGGHSPQGGGRRYHWRQADDDA